MAKNGLFRETPFNGYNRNDVLEYIKEQDLTLTELKSEAEKFDEEKTRYISEIEELKEKISEFNKNKEVTNEELKKDYENLKKENERLEKEITNRESMIAVFDDMKNIETDKNQEAFLSLNEECNILKSTLQKKDETIDKLKAEITEKEEIITLFQDEILSASEKFEALEEELKKITKEYENTNIVSEISNDATSETEEMITSAKIKSEYMIKNARYFAYSTKEKLLSVRKTIDNALADIEKSILSSETIPEDKED